MASIDGTAIRQRSNNATPVNGSSSNGHALDNAHPHGKMNGVANGNIIDGKSTGYASHITAHGREIDAKLDAHDEWEFGGPMGTAGMMLGFPCLMCESHVPERECF